MNFDSYGYFFFNQFNNKKNSEIQYSASIHNDGLGFWATFSFKKA